MGIYKMLLAFKISSETISAKNLKRTEENKLI